MEKRQKLTPVERDKLANLYSTGTSITEIAKVLQRSKSTISEEVKRNRRWDESCGKWVYEAIFAQTRANNNKLNNRKRNKLLTSSWLYSYVREKLSEGWSPEQIEGRLKLDYPNQYDHNIGHETIYQ